MGKRRPRNLILGCLLFLAGCAHADVLQVLDLGGGLNDSVPGNAVGDNESTAIDNFHVDPLSHGLIQRRGSRKQNSTQLTGNSTVDPFSHKTSLGGSYLISIASKTINSSVDNGATWTTILSTMTNGVVWDGVSFGDDNFYLVNQNDGGYQFTTGPPVAISSVTNMPAGKFIEAYQNRLFVANTAVYPYRVFFSSQQAATSWNQSTEWFDLPEAITSIGKPFDGGLPIYTANTTWILRGSGPSTFYLTQVSDTIGCADDRTVQNFIIKGTEYQIFFSLGQNSSHKGVYALVGDRVIDLSDKIRNLVDGVSVFDTSARAFDWDIASDFSMGVGSQTYVDSSAEGVKLSTWTGVDTSTADFSLGASVNIDTTTTPGQIQLAVNNNNIDNNSFETGTPDNWTLDTPSDSARVTAEEGVTPVSGTYMLKTGSGSTGVQGLVVEVIDSGGSVLSTTDIKPTRAATSFVQKTITLSSYKGQVIAVRIRHQPTGVASYFYYMTSDKFICSGSNMTLYVASGNGGVEQTYVDLFEGGRSTIYNGVFVSRAFDTAFSSAAWLPSTYTISSSSVVLRTQSSANGTVWGSSLPWVSGSSPSNGWNRYIRYQAEISTGAATTSAPNLSSVSLFARASTGTFQSEIKDGGVDLSALDVLNAQTSGDGAHAFYFRTNASSTALLSDSWSSISSGSDASGGERYYQFKDDFSITVSTHDPTLERVTQNYTSSAGSAQPADSVIWNNEYWMSYTSTSSQKNDKILVMNQDGAFSQFSALNIYGFAVHNRNLYGGDSVTDGSTGGYLRQLDYGTLDDGESVSASVTLKHQELTYSDYKKSMSGTALYFNYGVDVGTFTASLLENFSEVETPYTVYFASGTNINRWEIEANAGTTFKQIGLKFENSYPGSRLKIYPPINYHFQKSELIQQ